MSKKRRNRRSLALSLNLTQSDLSSEQLTSELFGQELQIQRNMPLNKLLSMPLMDVLCTDMKGLHVEYYPLDLLTIHACLFQQTNRNFTDILYQKRYLYELHSNWCDNP